MITREAVVYEDENLFLVNKPAGLSSHSDPEGKDVLTALQKISPQKLFLVHRLDRETSGLLLLTKKPELTQTLQKGMIRKKYIAIVRRSWVGDQETQWNWPLSDRGESRKKPQGLKKDQKPCTTRVQLIHSTSHFSVICAELESGRQHQIRKHAALARHPIWGDARYNDPQFNQKILTLYGTERLFLHACQLTLELKGKIGDWQAPVPEEFIRILPDVLSSDGWTLPPRL
ncbi:MAG: RluA family pseudouridine synthase [Proteobacteria bacterium]|nr:RluA family pseudouridine synthase [Pseudomonadota bacterium]